MIKMIEDDDYLCLALDLSDQEMEEGMRRFEEYERKRLESNKSNHQIQQVDGLQNTPPDTPEPKYETNDDETDEDEINGDKEEEMLSEQFKGLKIEPGESIDTVNTERMNYFEHADMQKNENEEMGEEKDERYEVYQEMPKSIFMNTLSFTDMKTIEAKVDAESMKHFQRLKDQYESRKNVKWQVFGAVRPMLVALQKFTSCFAIRVKLLN